MKGHVLHERSKEENMILHGYQIPCNQYLVYIVDTVTERELVAP